ncbi:hypothetical protein, conserved [Trypanosoma brucei gambiense DAL972]|uniref:Transmembrane protein 65 n=1 Tax=Trypanosoma brucei gambiense (strain MHOM/CI/86/DAL972) TaxID=679716 RepID=D0A3Q7_TRYB9|nr:hypothetical protein, conserved [Trypanosoma brucei gambiense DAL972]CBH15901.1 hypothetical protein, conserved [Trypanosoma brucei gambiense DAL972]|eukprot:XP_011778165.1 hypothetical protein, conserved [Trypanosoma brucei gambiense DAL972]
MRRIQCCIPGGISHSRRWSQRFHSVEGVPRLSQEELRRLVDILESDPKILGDIIGRLDAASRRRLIVAGGAIEWFGKDNAVTEMKRAGVDKDRFISPKDFDHWLEGALRRRQEEEEDEEVTDRLQKQAMDEADELVPYSTLLWVALVAGLPFVGFGFLDNAMMILAGDAIDNSFGLYFNCSVLTCAAMGNIFSGVLGMQLHGVIEKAVQRFNFRVPTLTENQMKGKRVFFAGHIGGTVGIMTGLLLGMIPLLLLDSDDAKNERTAGESLAVAKTN